MSKAVSGLMGGSSKRKTAAKEAQQQGERLAQQSQVLNDRNTELAKETAGARARRGRRLLAFKGQETGLRSKLGS
ncbi:hypothetical protein SAMN04515666_101346 [Bosea lupini]|uniref:Uncharacterized protein n=1 Tax=Bosea lupini TaxID=1036779 RepID=A0A1H7GFQ8_9HYPH|nr:hypothetical protein [Bosea lupini]SEK37106.1 hypothetical protein SAMN04515666_101346 [Bosea lupini]